MPATHQPDLADVIDATDRHPRTRRNFRMQYRLAVHTLIPWLEQLGALPPVPAVCEIGCGEGGVIDAFAERGAELALGTDIVGLLLEQISAPLAAELKLPVAFTTHDVIGDAIPDQWVERFDVVVLRDVIEHLDDAAAAMRSIRRIMKSTGTLLITFPPYTSPFGGHQQLLGTALGNLPFAHMLPSGMFEGIIKRGDPVNQDEVRRLHAIRCSVRGVKAAAAKAGLSLAAERYFGLRPVFRWKYAKPIPTLELTAIRSLPLVKQLAMEAALVFRINA
jgi:SAM-dependent methyltransferase